jgi:hypothetical protein
VLGDADVDADHRLFDVGPIQTRVGHRFVGAVDADTAGTRAAADFLLFLIFQLVVVADARQGRADVADIVVPHPAAAGQQRLAEVL